ncbi:MAG: glycosyltransferase [Leptospiraceae bacterium]|nr:glycosyltransferase [Leptospiraceae bacterium]
MKTLIVIPAYNEEGTIEEVVRGALEYCDVCVVDDASRDNTPNILAAIQKEILPGGHTLHIIRHESNTHIPGGIQDGMKLAVEKNYDYVITMDAGMSHLPSDLPLFMEAGDLDLVIGRRHQVENVPLYRRIISWKAARIMNYCLSDGLLDIKGPGIQDCTSGYRRYSRRIFEIIASAKLESRAFDFHMESLYLAVRNGASHKEVPITYKFSTSSFNRRVLLQAMVFARHLYRKKLHFSEPHEPGTLVRWQHRLYEPLRLLDKPWIGLAVFVLLYGSVTFFHVRKYDMNFTSMVRFGEEFADANPRHVPPNAVLYKSQEGDLGAGYDGQIFYFYSRSISAGLDYPSSKGVDKDGQIDASYRAPRIGYPFLIALFGFIGPNAAVFGMFFWNIVLMYLAYLCIREILGTNSHLAIFYLISPFALGSYQLLVSDAVVVSLVVIAYWAYQREKMLLFWGIASLAIITKEPALFLLFPLGLYELIRLDFRKAAIIAATLLIPLAWHTYLRFTLPSWSPTRLEAFIQPMQGMRTYLVEVATALGDPNNGLKDIARTLSRMPLLLLWAAGVLTLLSGRLRKGFAMRLGLFLSLLMIFVADHYYFWSVYDNISRMFTISVALVLLLKSRDHNTLDLPFHGLSVAVLLLYMIRVIWITPVMPHVIR